MIATAVSGREKTAQALQRFAGLQISSTYTMRSVPSRSHCCSVSCMVAHAVLVDVRHLVVSLRGWRRWWLVAVVLLLRAALLVLGGASVLTGESFEVDQFSF